MADQKIHESRKTPNPNPKTPVWDCGSTLYDSFELKSFERQLHSAINSSRSLSMPRLPDRIVVEAAVAPLPPPPPPPLAVSKKPSKISRSLHKFLKSVFKYKQNSTRLFRVKDRPGDEYYVVYDKSAALSTIPEVLEIDFGGFSPDIHSLLTRSGSERFTAASMIGISCA